MKIAHVLYAFCQWASHSWFGHGIRDSVWLFPVIEIFHLLALGLLGGTILILNARLLGLRFRTEPVAELAREIRPWMLGSLAVMLTSGFFLFSSEAVKMYGNSAFRVKMIALVVAITFTFTAHRKVTTSDEGTVAPFWKWVVALGSVLLWSCVGIAGRAIGFV
jgi:Family of unknown function (DUF6644)